MIIDGTMKKSKRNMDGKKMMAGCKYLLFHSRISSSPADWSSDPRREY
jgi:hypothetical protein